MSISPRGATQIARFAAVVEGDIWDAIVPVLDTRTALVGDARSMDRDRDRICRDVAVSMRDLMESETDPYKIKQAIREWMPALEHANLLDKRIDVVAFGQAPVSLAQAHEALLAGVSRCEGMLTDG